MATVTLLLENLAHLREQIGQVEAGERRRWWAEAMSSLKDHDLLTP